jgi:hypothetical protein
LCASRRRTCAARSHARPVIACPADTRGEQYHDETTAGGLEGVDRRLALWLGDFAGELV